MTINILINKYYYLIHIPSLLYTNSTLTRLLEIMNLRSGGKKYDGQTFSISLHKKTDFQ